MTTALRSAVREANVRTSNLLTAGMLGSEQYVVPVFLQYELENPTIAFSAFATFSSWALSSVAIGAMALRPTHCACDTRTERPGANATQPTAITASNKQRRMVETSGCKEQGSP